MRIKYARKFSFFYVAVKCTITGGQNRYGLVCAVMINPLGTANYWRSSKRNTYIASTGVRRY